MKTVFCDESGFTGEDLWQADQPHFVYAAVSVSERRAAEIVESIRQEYHTTAAELHAAQLIRRQSGKRAMMRVLKSLVPQSLVVVVHKRYALAAKMFEYLIEPAISDRNSIFYDIGFHKFVANGLYLALLSEPSTTAKTFIEFQDAIRTGDVSKLVTMNNGMNQEGMAGFLSRISAFVTCNQQALHEEIAASQVDGKRLPRWLLELTLTAITSLLASISGNKMVPLSVTCDESKPLLSQAALFDGFVGRTDYQEMTFDGRTNQLTFNLAHKIKFGSSALTPGLQLADLVAGAAAFALKRPEDEFADFWRTVCSGTLHRNSVIPDVDEMNLATQRAVVNAFVLEELVDRSIQGRNLLQGMREFIGFAQVAARQFLLENGAHP